MKVAALTVLAAGVLAAGVLAVALCRAAARADEALEALDPPRRHLEVVA